MEPEALASIAAAIVAAGAGGAVTEVYSRLHDKFFNRAVTAERDRLRTEVLGERPPTDSAVRGQPDENGQGAAGEIPSADQKFATLLIEYYAYGLTQARRSFSVSLSCSVLGGLVLIAGVGLAIFNANTSGEQYASVVASVAGLLTAAIGSLFHRRADLALKHMESQTQSLRQDMKVERDAGEAIRLLGEVADGGLKAHLQAALILKFSSAKLPELDGVLKSATSSSPPKLNGAVPEQKEHLAAGERRERLPVPPPDGAL
ncbi:TRADD-N-associated membrane domain-containing protein [Streptomyces sp. NPDC055140]